MGREVRRVPLGWEHPTDEHGHHIPMQDETYDEALASYEQRKVDFAFTEHAKEFTFEEWEGDSPQPEWYRPAWPADAQLGWCIYENVSEGTPVSPVFSEPEALHQWLVGQGYSPDAAARFLVNGSAPSFVVDGSGLRDGIAAS